jgi:lysyl oxidase
VIRRLLVLIGVAAGLVAPGVANASTLEPDMGMARLDTVKLDTTTQPGHRLLRYTAIMVNVGAGQVQINGTRPDTTAPMTVTQRLFNSDGTFTDLPVPVSMAYAGDGHHHWHALDMEGGTLQRTDNGLQVGALAKHGFCFFDNVKYRLTLPGSPASAVYTHTDSCALNNPAALNVTMGISVGWGDSYPASTNFQWIDITGLPNGRYRLTATADPMHALVESSYANNSAWAIVSIHKSSVSILRSGPGA